MLILALPCATFSQEALKLDIGDDIINCNSLKVDSASLRAVCKGGTPPYKLHWFITDTSILNQYTEPDMKTFFHHPNSLQTKIRQGFVLNETGSVKIFAQLVDSNGTKILDSLNYFEGRTTYTLAINEATIDKGDSIELHSNVYRNWPMVKYEWAPDNGLSRVDVSNPMASPNNTTTYKVKIWDQMNCLSIDRFTIIVN